MQPTPDDLALDYHSAETFHVQWLRQFFENLPHLPPSKLLQSLSGRFKGKPALVISRGPSLDAALPAIQALQDSAVLIAVGGAVRRLWEGGITPDFALFYDANGLREQRQGIPDEVWARIASVIHPCAQPGCFDAPSRETFHFFTQYHKHVATWLQSALEEDIPLLGGGGSVSIIALRQALLMGCDPIVLVGQDLAFPDNQVYAGGIGLQTDGYGQMSLTRSDTLYAEPERMTTVTGQNGETMPALHSFPSFIRQLERIAAESAGENGENPQGSPAKEGKNAASVQLYNASLGGAHIEGYSLKPLSDFEGQWPLWKQGRHALDALSGTIEEDISAPKPERGDLKHKLIVGLQALQRDLLEAEALCRTLEKELLQSGAKSNPQTLQGAIQRFAGFLDREGNAFLAFIPAFEMHRYRRQFQEAVAMRRQGMQAIPDMHAEFVRLMQICLPLFETVRTTAAEAEARLSPVGVAD